MKMKEHIFEKLLSAMKVTAGSPEAEGVRIIIEAGEALRRGDTGSFELIFEAMVQKQKQQFDSSSAKVLFLFLMGVVSGCENAADETLVNLDSFGPAWTRGFDEGFMGPLGNLWVGLPR